MADMWQIEVRHPQLNKYRLIRGRDRYDVEQRAAVLKVEWDEKWASILDKESKIKQKEEKISYAVQLTKEAEKAVEEIENILKHTLTIDDRIDWESLKDNTLFPKIKPNMPALKQLPQQPNRNDEKYNIQINLLDQIFKGRIQKKKQMNDRIFESDLHSWNETKKEYSSFNKRVTEDYKKVVSEWESESRKYYKLQEEKNKSIDIMKEKYIEKNKDVIVQYCELVLRNSKYPSYIPKEYEIDYNENNKLLIINYSLPFIGEIPKLKEVKYIQSKDQYNEISLKEAQINQLYDSLVYQVTLRTIHEVIEADVIDAIESVVFNGWVNHIDLSSGNEKNVCIVSVQVTKSDFLSINLEKIDPKSCFRKLKGVGSSKIFSLTPIAPIINLNKEDKRFVSAQHITLNEGLNVASMDWEDFEHLIREVFEKEFSQNGNEVKITRASRDGGVDAVVFDNDPIRGGKIVIQAKRYTNTVGVSAVRDLYGTVVNEGALKGILVTTADYGPDSYEFAKGKPLTLLNGSNLLHLLQKHGHKAHIDIKDAKRLLMEKERNDKK